MPSRVIEVFEDEKLIEKIKKRLPYLFHLEACDCDLCLSELIQNVGEGDYGAKVDDI